MRNRFEPSQELISSLQFFNMSQLEKEDDKNAYRASHSSSHNKPVYRDQQIVEYVRNCDLPSQRKLLNLSYSVTKNSCPFSDSNYTMKIWLDFLDIRYVFKLI